jgi:hypothetical protein
VLHRDAVVRLNGAVLASDDGRVGIALRAGVHLVQVTTPSEERTLLLDMEGIPLRPEVPAVVLTDGPSLREALVSLQDDPEGDRAAAARGILLAEAASRNASWGLVVAARKREGERRAQTAVLRVDPLARTVTPFSGAPARSDMFARRGRIALAVESRRQARGADAEGLTYGGGSITLWAPIAQVVRVGAGFTIVGTSAEAPPGKTACCALPSVDGRLRIEFPKGVVRPYGELAGGVLWPDGDPEVVSWSLEGGGGVILVPGAVKRIGINLGALAGNVAAIGGYFKLRVAAEVRF